MEVESLSIPDVKLIKPKRFGDDRGYFEQSYHQRDYFDHGIKAEFVQDNHSRSSRGVLRGLHYQLQYPQAKLVSVFVGSVFDVAVDLRQSSPYFGQWVGVEISAQNGYQLLIPRGFAHGFLVLSKEVDFYYKCDDFYSPEDERAVRWDDPLINIKWPLDGLEPVLSEKDMKAPALENIKKENLYAENF